MKVLRHIVAAMALLALGTVMTGCFYWPHDEGLHRGEYERDRGYHQERDRGDRHDRGRDREHERDRDHRD
jgi:hypothetical protein